MNWILEHFQVVVVIASAFAWWLSQRREQAGNDDDTPADRPGREPIDSDELERTRRVQEEIRRKIAERRGGTGAPARSEPVLTPRQGDERPSPEATTPPIPPILRELLGMPPEPPPMPPPMPREEPNPVLERHRRMEAEIRELEQTQREAEAMAARVRVAPAAARPVRAAADALGDEDWLATLRDQRSARRAVLLREILGKPVGLR